MKTKKLSIYFITKHISYELLLEEQLQSKAENTKLLESLSKKRNALKIKFILNKIINSIIFAIQPIFLLMAYLNLNLNISVNFDPPTRLFIEAINFHFFFIVQFFNFFLVGLFNLTNIMSGDTYDWVKTLPFSRKDLKKLVFYSIYHNLNLPILTNTFAFPVIMLIATQNFFVFLISIGLSIMNMIFSLAITIILGEKIAKFMKRHGQKSRKPLFIQLLNSFSYALIIFGGIFVIEVVLNLLIPFLSNLPDLHFSRFYNLILFLIPFPINASYIILIFTSIPQMHLISWLNLLYGFGLYLIAIYFLVRKSFKSLGAVLSFKYKDKGDDNDRFDDKYQVKIHTASHSKAFIRKDLLIASRDLQTAMYFIMPIINSFTFMFFFNLSLFGVIGSLGIDVFFYNWLVILGISPFLSGTIIYTILNIDKNGKTIIDTLPIIRRDQARSKIFIIILIQTLALITPNLIYIFHPKFIDLFLASLSALPLVLIFSITTFLLRIHFFGKKKYYYSLDEISPTNKTGKWTLILGINFLIYLLSIAVSYYLFYIFNFLVFIFNIIFLSLILSLSLKGNFDRCFPKKKKKNWSLIMVVALMYCYIFAHLLLLNSIISISLQDVIPISFLFLTGFILIFKYVKIPKQTLKKIIKKLIPKPTEKKVKEKSNWTGILLILSILFFAYSVIPFFINIVSIIYSLIGFFLIITGLSLIIKMLRSQKKKSEKKLVETRDFFQIDLLKAAMIFLVIFDHTIPWEIKNEMGVALWERISIPVFLVIMGFNFGRSYKTRGKDNFGTKYLFRKLSRYLLPFVIIYIISIALGLYFYGDNVQIWFLRQDSSFEFIHVFIGILPFWGPGNWFIPLLFGSIIILPIIFKGFSGKTIWAFLTLILCFLIEIGMQYIVYSQFKPFTYQNISTVYMFLCNILYYTSAIGLGMWISRNHKLFSWHNIINWILFLLSLIYIIGYQFFDFIFKDSNGIPYLTGDYNFLVTPYSAFLVLLVIKLIPKTKKGIITRAISVIGKSTYHILLTQIMYFAILIAIYGNHYGTSILGVATDDLNIFINLFVNWSICVPIGVIWWSTENSIRNFSRKSVFLKDLSHSKAKNRMEILEFSEKTLKLSPEDSSTKQYKNLTLEKVREIDGLIKWRPNAIKEWYNKSIKLYTFKEFKEVIKCSDEILKLDQNQANAYFNKGISLLKLGNDKEGMNNIRKAEELDPKNPDRLTSIGAINANRGEYDLAVQYYDKVLKLDPNFERALKEKKVVLNRLGIKEFDSRKKKLNM